MNGPQRLRIAVLAFLLLIAQSLLATAGHSGLHHAGATPALDAFGNVLCLAEAVYAEDNGHGSGEADLSCCVPGCFAAGSALVPPEPGTWLAASRIADPRAPAALETGPAPLRATERGEPRAPPRPTV